LTYGLPELQHTSTSFSFGFFSSVTSPDGTKVLVAGLVDDAGNSSSLLSSPVASAINYKNKKKHQLVAN
jgi:hypothetical protein